jgi:parvulin-like peptidyl-prolyl isomerase
LPDKRLPGEVTRTALELAAGKVSEPVKSSQGVFVVKALERRAPDASGFDKERDELGRQLLERKKIQAWDAWVTSLRAAAKIDLNNRIVSPQ